MKLAIIVSTTLVALCMSACTKPPVEGDGFQVNSLSPILRYDTQEQLCTSVAYVFDFSEQSHTRYMKWYNEIEDKPFEYTDEVISAAKSVGPGTPPFQEFAGEKSDAWLLDDTNRGETDRHFELASRYRKAGNTAYRYHLLRALRPPEARFVSNSEGVQFKFVRNDVTGIALWAKCAAHYECPSVRKPSRTNMPYCDRNWWPRTEG